MEIDNHQATAKEAIEPGGLSIEIDQDSLSAFVQSSPQTATLEKVIANISNAPVSKRLDEQFPAEPATSIGNSNSEQGRLRRALRAATVGAGC